MVFINTIKCIKSNLKQTMHPLAHYINIFIIYAMHFQNVLTVEIYSGQIHFRALIKFTRDEVLPIIDKYAPIFPRNLLHNAWCITALNRHKQWIINDSAHVLHQWVMSKIFPEQDCATWYTQNNKYQVRKRFKKLKTIKLNRNKNSLMETKMFTGGNDFLS